MILKLGMKHQGIWALLSCINHDPGMTLIYFAARSTYVAHAFEWAKLLKCHMKDKTCRTWEKWSENLRF